MEDTMIRELSRCTSYAPTSIEYLMNSSGEINPVSMVIADKCDQKQHIKVELSENGSRIKMVSVNVEFFDLDDPVVRAKYKDLMDVIKKFMDN